MEEVHDKLVFSMMAGLGNVNPQTGERTAPQFTIHTSADRDCSPAELNAVLDKMRGAYERQLAIAEIARLEKDVRMAERMIASVKAGAKAVEDEHAAAVATKRSIVKGFQDKVPGVVHKDQQAFAEGGRAGDYKQSNTAASEIAALRRGAAKVEGEIATLDLERDRAMREILDKAGSWEESNVQDRAEIARLQAIVDGEPPPRKLKAA